MKLFQMLTIAAAVATSAIFPAISQAEGPAATGIPGYLDVQTGTFKPMVQSPQTNSPQVPTAVTGVIKMVLTIDVISTDVVTTSTPITCGLNTQVSELANGFFYTNQATATATRSGNVATCTVDLPYEWKLGIPSDDTVSPTFTVNAVDASGAPLRLQTAQQPGFPVGGGTTTLRYGTHL